MNNQQKQQVIEQVKSANNVLVTVSSNPTVDELAASVGLTLALNRMGKHATTVFSGVVPSTIEFLQPEQTIETTTDSLRDFIIALDKSKADKLRYKVEDDVVRIFITPYRSTITDKDLDFSHGDFNVDVVIAIGVTRREDLDRAVTAHGRILHDATVVSITRESNSELGSINWQEPQSSSLCEMVGAMTIDVKSDVLDGQMATAFLTGIIAETDRFKNEKTTPSALALSSQLMSSGANQQLIAEKLEEPEAPPAPIHNQDNPEQNNQNQENSDGTLSIAHDEHADIPNEHEEQVDKIHIDEHGNLGPHPEEEHEDDQNRYLNHDEHNQDKDEDGHEHGELDSFSQNKDNNRYNDSHIPVMKHERKVLTPPSEEGKPKTDKPFDLNAAIAAANNEDLTEQELKPESEESPEPEPEPVAEPEPELSLPKPEENIEHPKIVQEHSGPMLDHPPSSQPQEDFVPSDSPQDFERPSGSTPSSNEDSVQTENQEQNETKSSEEPKTDESNSESSEEHIPTPEPVIQDKAPEPISEPSPIPVVPDQTLTQLEKAVDSPHVPPQANVDQARDAVASAAASRPPAIPEPSASIGAQNVDLQKVAEEVAQSEETSTTQNEEAKPEVVDPTAPPPVPPPMSTPQFYDADGNNQNPFSNPNI